jgi:hypothetical protein
MNGLNLIEDEIKSRLNSSDACKHSLQDLLPSCLLRKNVNIRIIRTINSPVVPHGCETCFLVLTGKQRLRVIDVF